MIVCDTGPLYAAADSSDAHHNECSDLLNRLPRPLVVPISVMIETSFLIEHRLGPAAEARFLAELAGGDFQVEQLSPDDLRRATPSSPTSSTPRSAIGCAREEGEADPDDDPERWLAVWC